MCCFQYPLPDFAVIVDQIRSIYLNRTTRVKYNRLDYSLIDYYSNEKIASDDAALLYVERADEMCITANASLNGRLCHSKVAGNEEDTAGAECDRVCCHRDCFVRRREMVNEEEKCLMNLLGVEICEPVSKIKNNYYCCSA
jgi:hypothetical protein